MKSIPWTLVFYILIFAHWVEDITIFAVYRARGEVGIGFSGRRTDGQERQAVVAVHSPLWQIPGLLSPPSSSVYPVIMQGRSRPIRDDNGQLELSGVHRPLQVGPISGNCMDDEPRENVRCTLHPARNPATHVLNCLNGLRCEVTLPVLR